MRKTIAFLSILTLCGCVTEVNVETTKQWEGHYFSTNDFVNATKNINLDKGESIWVLNNTTLKRLLKNTGK